MHARTVLPKTNLSVYPLCLGGNVFGWSADREQSFEVLDLHQNLGGNFIDTADVYSAWVPGNRGGESESIIGEWLETRGARHDTVIATKVAKWGERPGLSRANIIAACDESLRRLRTDYIDLYYAHEDDATVSLEETLGAFDELVRSGKVRYVAASNYTGNRLREALQVSEENGYAKYVALQNWYNLLDRDEFETDSKPVLEELGISALPFFSLARGFLSGKYQPGSQVESVRADGVGVYQNQRGWAILAEVMQIAGECQATPSAVALAWLRAKPIVSAPIASARTPQQLQEIMQLVSLDASQLERLDAVGAA